MLKQKTIRFFQSGSLHPIDLTIVKDIMKRFKTLYTLFFEGLDLDTLENYSFFKIRFFSLIAIEFYPRDIKQKHLLMSAPSSRAR